jgi:hypothetical protein
MQSKFRVFHLGKEHGNNQPFQPDQGKILREYEYLPTALVRYFSPRGIHVTANSAPISEDGVIVTLDADVSEGVLKTALERYLVAVNTAPIGSVNPMCYGAEEIP